MKNKKLIIIIVVVALIGLGVFVYLRKKESQDVTSPIGGDTGSTSTSPFPLKYGSKGPEVTQLEKYLIKQYGARVSTLGIVDDTWGPFVDAAVKKFLATDQVTKELYDSKKMGTY